MCRRIPSLFSPYLRKLEIRLPQPCNRCASQRVAHSTLFAAHACRALSQGTSPRRPSRPCCRICSRGARHAGRACGTSLLLKPERAMMNIQSKIANEAGVGGVRVVDIDAAINMECAGRWRVYLTSVAGRRSTSAAAVCAAARKLVPRRPFGRPGRRGPRTCRVAQLMRARSCRAARGPAGACARAHDANACVVSCVMKKVVACL